MTKQARIRLRGPGGEPVDLWRTIVSHGLANLPPMKVDDVKRTLTVTVPLARGRPRTVTLAARGSTGALLTVHGSGVSEAGLGRVVAAIERLLRLDEDLSAFYELISEDPHLSWVAGGAGRMVRSATVFEEVVKTICTTNCSWALTRKMIGALVSELGEPAPGAPKEGPEGRAFPTPEAMAATGEAFYRDVVRAGYRAPYFRALGSMVASEGVDLEVLGTSTREQISDDEIEQRLLALPGVGPYAAAHIMLMIGRYSRLILDSWTRPTYAKIIGRRSVSDAAIERRFRRYGDHAGLAFWLFLTRDWIADTP